MRKSSLVASLLNLKSRVDWWEGSKRKYGVSNSDEVWFDIFPQSDRIARLRSCYVELYSINLLLWESPFYGDADLVYERRGHLSWFAIIMS